MAERAISVRLDEGAAEALELLVESGLTQSEAIRTALVDSARRRRDTSLAAEARRLAADPEDVAELAEVAELMEALRAEG